MSGSNTAKAALGKDPWVIFVNRRGVRLTAGDDDSARNRSRLLRSAGLQSVRIPASIRDDAYWNELMPCVASVFADFNVRVTDQRPTSGKYILVSVGGTPSQLRRGDSKLGIAPIGGKDPRAAVVFAFERGHVPVVTQCTTIAHEVGHALGLDHTSLTTDIMGQGFVTQQEFQNRPARCGSKDRPRDCRDGARTQNSYGRIAALIGLRPGVSPRSPNRERPKPTVVRKPATHPDISVKHKSPGIDSAGRGARVAAGERWIATVTATDPDGIAQVSVRFQSPSGRVELVCGDPAVPDASCRRSGDNFVFSLRIAAKRQFVAFQATDTQGNRFSHQMVTEVTPRDDDLL